MSTEILLRATQLSCVRQDNIIFDNLSFELNAGELLLVEGANGSGKSSLLRLLTGLTTPAKGEVFWKENAITSDYVEHLHYVGHANGIKLGLTVEENCELIIANSSSRAEILSTLKLNPNSFAKNLSAGQKRKLALARLFLISKTLWVLDEPLTALDVDTQSFFLSALEKHLSSGGIAVISSHNDIKINKNKIKKISLRGHQDA